MSQSIMNMVVENGITMTRFSKDSDYSNDNDAPSHKIPKV